MIEHTPPEYRTLPFFVYGTLRPGFGNSRTWQGQAIAEHDGDAMVSGFQMRSNGGFPYIDPTGDPDHIVIGAVIRPAPGRYHEVLKACDSLEGCPSHYVRKVTAVITPDDVFDCWIYVPSMTWWEPDQYDLIECGDWKTHVLDRAARTTFRLDERAT